MLNMGGKQKQRTLLSQYHAKMQYLHDTTRVSCDVNPPRIPTVWVERAGRRLISNHLIHIFRVNLPQLITFHPPICPGPLIALMNRYPRLSEFPNP